MQTSDANGEISATVDETNRVRAELGLKPLAAEAGRDAQRDAEAARRGAELAAAQAKGDEQEAMRAKLDAARRQRLLTQKMAGRSLGEQLAGEEMDSAAAWVSKSRDQQEARAERRREGKAERKPRARPKTAAEAQSSKFDEMDEESQVAGALVGHGADEFKAGESVVLTLADQQVVQTEANGYALNDGDEMLENVNMADDFRRNAAKKAATAGRYNPYGEDGMSGPDSSGVLGKYDAEGKAHERKTLRLDAAGTVDEAKEKKLAAIKARLAAASGAGAGGGSGGGGGKVAYDLSGIGAAATTSAAGDYQSAAEAAAEATFLKPKGDGKKKKLRRKKRESLDLDAMAAETAAEMAAAGGGGGADRGTRDDRAARHKAAAEEEARRAAAAAHRFDRAVENAQDKTTARLGTAAEHKAIGAGGAAGAGDGDAMEVDGGNGNGGGNGGGDGGAGDGDGENAEVDSELYSALARSRRLAALQAERRNEDTAAERLAKQVARAAAAEAAAAAEGEAAGGTDLMSLAFTETGEFVKGVRGKEQVAEEEAELPSTKFKEYRAEAERAAIEGGAEEEARLLEQARPKERRVKEEPGGFVDGDEEPEEEAAAAAADGDEEEEEDDDDGDELGYLHETTTQGGLAGALEMARGRGMLGADGPTSGRMFDQKGAGLHDYEADDGDGEGKAGFELNYFDEYGRKMTQKQAFRQLSWKFHGKGPSKKRREKRMQDMERQMDESSKDRAMDYMGALQHAQQSSKSAHVVLSGINAIRPADVAAAAAGGGGGERAKKKAKKGGPAGGFNTG